MSLTLKVTPFDSFGHCAFFMLVSWIIIKRFRPKGFGKQYLRFTNRPPTAPPTTTHHQPACRGGERVLIIAFFTRFSTPFLGKIAGETSAAYTEIFTLSYVSGRTVGIGAYLVRLGQRVIQKVSSPIILTGFRALNKVLGRDVYTSNLQVTNQ